ncbi:AAA family ATPase [Bradyrhizobium ontarionense]|uniref:AAA family ATPase n=1 Tax=Bradyrhizobium ontarionense TaxID=2898149 RepID=A0ABY3RKM6_9BRAD|nr:AAA family ATPase [Bradyrhizobium sp. A19]UFZ07819.1 AAA family ATPase [Bradyrhizobium sp. A19]
MRPKIVALTGLSGVGKSTLLVAVAPRLPFQHLEASSLIKKGRAIMLGQTVAQDQLRYSDLDENQNLLVRGLEASINHASQLVVLDSHTLIERDTEHFLIGPEVFAALELAVMIFLREEPHEIEKRRVNDQSRLRPRKDAAALAKVQAEAVAQAELICREIGVPLHVEMPSNVDGLVDLLCRYSN